MTRSQPAVPTVSYSIRLTPDKLRALRESAYESRVAINAWILQAIDAKLHPVRKEA